MLKLIICGINGTMGTHVYNYATKNGHNVACGIDKVTVGKTECPVYNDFDQVKELADVIVDFSSPSALNSLLTFATLNKIPLVLCSTGYSADQENLIKDASYSIPIFKSSNTSLGILILARLCKIASSSLKNYDVEIIESHHKNKKDSPSGTANLLFDNICDTNGIKPIYGRKENSKRSQGEICIHSIRGGTTVGEHSVLFLGEHETITLTHVAQSKELFAKGALLACEFIKSKPNGLYSMQDLPL